MEEYRKQQRKRKKESGEENVKRERAVIKGQISAKEDREYS